MTFFSRFFRSRSILRETDENLKEIDRLIESSDLATLSKIPERLSALNLGLNSLDPESSARRDLQLRILVLTAHSKNMKQAVEESLMEGVKQVLKFDNQILFQKMSNPEDKSPVVDELKQLCQFSSFKNSSMIFENGQRCLNEKEFSQKISKRVCALRATLKENQCKEGKLALHTENAFRQQASQIDNPCFSQALLKERQSFEDLRTEQEASIVVFGENVAVALKPKRVNRPSEDRFLVTSFNIFVNNIEHFVDVYAVFDGTLGFEVSDYACKNITNNLQTALNRLKELTPRSIQKALKQAFVEFSIQLAQSKEESFADQGKFFYGASTANVVVKIKEQLYAANVGDSRSLIVSDQKTQQLTLDMNFPIPKELEESLPEGKNITKDEIDKILNHFNQQSCYQKLLASMRKCGQALEVGAIGRPITIRLEGRESARVLGGLFSGLQSKPTVTMVDMDPKGSILVITSDGLTHFASTNQIGAFVQERKNLQADVIAKQLLEMNHAAEKEFEGLKGHDCSDDKTIMVIKF